VITRRSITRREALAVGSQVLAGVTLGCRLPGRPVTSPSVPRFRRSFQTPVTLTPVRRDETTDYYEITHRAGALEIIPERPTPIWGYDGRAPGPTIHARRGRRVVVRHENQLGVPTVVHLHGGVTPSDSDGFPTDLIAPGASKTYDYPNEQPAATLWYHDHAMHQTGRNIYMGLAGLYLVHDQEEDDLPLPRGEHDVPLLIQERSFSNDGQLRYERDRNLGALGDVVLVNGVPWPRMSVSTRKYRLRVVNGTNASPLRLALSSGRPLVQIATDAGLLESPRELASLPLAMAERAEVIADFSTYPIGSVVMLRDLNVDGPRGEIMCFDVVRDERDTASIPARLSTVEQIPTSAAARTREIVFGAGRASLRPQSEWTIDGKEFDPEHPIAAPRLGDVEVWRLVNRKRFGIIGMVHPVHIHLVRFQIVARNGGSPPGAHETGWKDTVAVPSGETATVIARFEGHRGRYLIHCHNLEHEDHAMMARYDVV
jgi:spore coat protein A, manganese oxidase